MKRILNISRVHNDIIDKQYRIELEPNYWFSTSGSDISICNSIREVYESIKHIVFCDGI